MATQTTWTDLLGRFDSYGGEHTTQDVDIYMLALYSYPDRFADEPYLSFEQHLHNVIHAENRRAVGNLQS
jgi:hypothetical protein